MQKRAKIVVVGLVIICASVGIVWFIRGRVRTTPVNTNQSTTTNPVVSVEAQKALQAKLEQLKQSDGDLDGLTDAQEGIYHTNPNLPDTDADGLLDADEIALYKTDPLKADTYAIGHNDGWAVRRHIILPGGKIDRTKIK